MSLEPGVWLEPEDDVTMEDVEEALEECSKAAKAENNARMDSTRADANALANETLDKVAGSPTGGAGQPPDLTSCPTKTWMMGSFSAHQRKCWA